MVKREISPLAEDVIAHMEWHTDLMLSTSSVRGRGNARVRDILTFKPGCSRGSTWLEGFSVEITLLPFETHTAAHGAVTFKSERFTRAWTISIPVKGGVYSPFTKQLAKIYKKACEDIAPGWANGEEE